VELRDARPDDALEVAAVHVRSWQAAYRGLVPDAFLDGMKPEERAARYTFGDTDAGGPRTVLATEAGSVTGFATYGPCRDPDASGCGELYAIYLDPSAWGRGTGRALIAEARDRLAGDGFVTGVLWVLAGNARARNFYEMDGWSGDGTEQTVAIGGAELSEVRYRRALKPGSAARVPRRHADHHEE
jgi:GNAT superfamily N-acetyltransferase